MIYLLHGGEEFEKSERIAALRAGISEDPSFIEMNLTVLEGRNVTRSDFIHACDVPPFLGEYRLVLIKDLVGRAGKDEGDDAEGGGAPERIEWLWPLLSSVPDSTVLVFDEGKKLGVRHPLVKAVTALGSGGKVELFETPDVRKGALATWVEDRARRNGAKLDPGVANDLAAFIGPDLRLIDSELQKLAAYANGRPVRKTDVRLLVPYAQEANIFDMVDALGHRQTQQAFRLLAQLRREGAHPLYLLTMIVRQYRILLQVKDLMGEGAQKEAIASSLGLHPFPTGKAMEQSRRYSPDQLSTIYGRLLDTDAAIKTGRIDADMALDVLVVELARA